MILHALKKRAKRAIYKFAGNDSMMDGRCKGRFYVLYPDGKRSIKMFYRQAHNYAAIFGGKVMDDF